MKAQNTQPGFALLIFVVVLLGLAGVVGSNLIQSKVKSVSIEKVNHDQAVLAKAKQALLSFAVEYNRPPNSVIDMGRLPCPDTTSGGTEGQQDGNCGNAHANSSGYLPWKTLGIELLRDSSGECLWYVVSGEYKDTPPADMLNEDSNGLLLIQDENAQLYHGSNPGDRPIAAIIAPGPKLGTQNRTSVMTQCHGNYTESNYLEAGGLINYTTNHANTEDDIWTYLYPSATNNLQNNSYNDRIVWISKSEYWAAVKAQGDLDASDTSTDINKLTEALAECVADYGNDPQNENEWLPWPAAIDMAEYRDNGSYIDQDFSVPPSPLKLMGRFPYNISSTNSHESGTQSLNMTNFMSNCLTVDELALWENWKDHFFYVVSEGFEMMHGETDSDLKDRCSSDKCVKIDDGTADKVAAIVFYSGSALGNQIRDYGPVDTDEKDKIKNYLETDPLVADNSNAHQYPVDSAFSGNARNFYRGLGDITYCVEAGTNSFSVNDCN
jgi:hypothetical protein